MRYNADEIKILEGNPYIQMVSPLTFVMKNDLCKDLFNMWIEEKTPMTIRKGLCQHGIPNDLISEQYISAVEWGFRGNFPHLGGNRLKDRACDIALVASGLFIGKAQQVVWNPELRRSLLRDYPGIPIEEGIIRSGLTVEMVGIQRISALRHICKTRAGQTGTSVKQNNTEDGNTDKHEEREGAWRYEGHPYIAEVHGNRSLSLRDSFYNEAAVLEEVPVPKVLELYELDPEILGKRCVSEIYMKLLTWKRTDERQEVWDEQVLRIQMKRYRMLQAQTEKAFEQIRSAAASLRPLQKKQLCLDLSGYPTREEYPCGMSIRQILEKAGISKTVYYRAINDKSYGLSGERRADRDREDFAKIIRVMEYKGFGKGVRQIYMMMPDLTGETFALSKIRRLLRQNGIRTKIRGRNPARQRMDKFLEKNRRPNILKREFRLHRPGEVRLTDVTYLRYGQGEEKEVAYGSSCIDPVTGRLLVFHISRKNDLELALDTLEKLSDHPAVEGALFHSDQGTLYFTDDFQDRVKELGMTQSMSKRGNCWDNAPQESFFGHFKDECPYGGCGSFEELCQMIEGYAWYYNNERRQWDRKRMTPIQYEEHLLSLDEEGFEEYMRTERAKYDRMKEKAEKKARERAKTLGV